MGMSSVEAGGGGTHEGVAKGIRDGAVKHIFRIWGD